MENKLIKILNDINAAREKTLSDNIESRLNKLLNQYIIDLNNVYSNVLNEDLHKVIKELSK